MRFAMGIGLTNACNYNCSHCYSRGPEIAYLPFGRFKFLCDNLEIESMNFGTGESYLHPDFMRIVQYAHGKGIRLSVTSNGYTINNLDDAHLKIFNDVDLSLDFENSTAHDTFRGTGAASDVYRGVERCKKLGVEVSLVTAMMKDNYNQMDRLVSIAKSLEVNLRINTYKPVNTFKHALSYEEFWQGIQLLLEPSALISCSEPVVNALIGNKTLDGGSPCGKKSLRINPNGGIVPCVYWKEPRCTIEDLVAAKASLPDPDFQGYVQRIAAEPRIIPEACVDCKHLDICKGGCAASSYYRNINEPDPYCHVLRGDTPQIRYKWGESKSLVHSNYLCTIIVH